MPVQTFPNHSSEYLLQVADGITAVSGYPVATPPATPVIGQILFGYGHPALAVQDRPPKITFVRIGGPIGSTKGATAYINYGGTGYETARALRGRSLKVNAYCWGDNFDQCEDLIQFIVQSIERVGMGSFKIHEEFWPGEKDMPTEGYVTRGEMVVLQLELQMPIIDASPTLVKPTSVEIKPEMEGYDDQTVTVG